MPDWTYHPLRGFAAAVLGVRRSQRLALRVLAAVGGVPGGRHAVAWGLGQRRPPEELSGSVAGVPVRARVGATVPPRVARDAVRALPLVGAGVIEVAPVGLTEVPAVRAAAAGRRVPVLARATGQDASAVAAALAPYVDAVVDSDTDIVRAQSVPAAARALADRRTTVLATPDVLVDAGPGWFQRVLETAGTTTEDPRPGGRITLDPRRWPPWWWGVLVGAGLIAGALAAAAITLGPVLLWYDRAFLGADTDRLQAVNGHLVPFVRHDRVSLAGTMAASGVLYVGLAAGGMRRGRPLAREAYLASGLVGFPTVFYLLGTGWVEPLHLAATAILLPMFAAAMWPDPNRPQWRLAPDGPESERRRALLGQLLLILVGGGLVVGGAVVSTVGLTGVFVPSDLEFLGTTSAALDAHNPHLLPFIAHDRAGFGGTLMSAGTGILLLVAWAWRRGEAWVWWTLAVAAGAGFLPALVVHVVIGYVDAGHLAPVVVAATLTTAGLALSRSYLCAPAIR